MYNREHRLQVILHRNALPTVFYNKASLDKGYMLDSDGNITGLSTLGYIALTYPMFRYGRFGYMAKKNKKSLGKLARRLKSFVESSKESKVQQRWSSGGYPKPGSQNRHKSSAGGRRK